MIYTNEYISGQRQKFEIPYKQIREMNSATDYEYLQDELIDRFGNTQMLSPTTRSGLVKAYLDQVFVRLERKQQK